MFTLLVLLPLLGAIIAWLIPSNRHRPLVLPLFALAHLVLLGLALASPPPPSPGGWLRLDPLGALFLATLSLLFTACAFYAVGYLACRQERSNRVLCMSLLVCLSAMVLVTISHHLGLLWMALETTTLTMAPLIYFNQNPRSVEATWKYMLVCSIGIALALLGLFFLAYASLASHQEVTLLLEPLIAAAPGMYPAWLNAAFVFLLVGFGTKIGLAPLHTWKPDAYGEAPGLVGAILAGGMVNCGLLAIIRVFQVCISRDDSSFFHHALIAMGLISMATAAVFLARQTDFKRMLAYSSVEHVGILALALGIGGDALFGALFHMVGNGLTKGVLFLSSGNIHRSFGSKNSGEVTGAIRRVPWSGAIFLAGFIAITGSPPFSPFLSEFTILNSAFSQGHMVIGGGFILFLCIVFIGMANTVLTMVMGDPAPDTPDTGFREQFLTVAPPLVLLAVVLTLGVWLPEPFMKLLSEAANLLEVKQ
jgi:hydrogenase-4 component F